MAGGVALGEEWRGEMDLEMADAFELRRALDAPDFKRRLRDGTAWLAGTA